MLGRNPVVECLRAGVPATALYVALGTDSDERLTESVQTAADTGIAILEVPRHDLDRIAANGDTANKIGTYSLAVLAKENDIPFYVAAPTSTVDLGLQTGDEIQIEEGPQEEVTHFQGVATAPPGVPALNPSFDVTPSRYITAIVTEEAVCRPPYLESLNLAVGASSGERGSG